MLSQNNIMGCVMNAPLDTITIPLTKGYSTVIDAVDADLAEMKWQARALKGGLVYVTRTNPDKWSKTYLHRVIAARTSGSSIPPGYEVDHINGNGCDNRRANLRIATHQQNLHNQKLRSTNTSGIAGVCWSKASQKWTAEIWVSGKKHYLGLFTDFDEAVAIRRGAEIQHYKEFSPLLSRQDTP